MMETIMFLLKSSVCIGIFYLFYNFFLTRETNFKLLRVYLLFAIILSLLLPVSKYTLNIDVFKHNFNQVAPAQNVTAKVETTQITDNPLQIKNTSEDSILQPRQKINWLNLSLKCYFLIVVFFLARLLVQFAQLFKIILKSPKTKKSFYTLVFTNRITNSFSFFHWIIINKGSIEEVEMERILAHEKIHVSQYHTLDLIVVELLSAVMWFNPAIWMMKNEIQLVHEYLADEGALSTGLDKLRYQALLVNQVAEEKLICLSSGFNHSLIKKRIVMMTKSKFNQRTKLKILALVPIAVVLFIGIACVNGQNKEDNPKVVTAVAPVKMNVLYIGVDNPMSIAVSGYNPDDLTVTIDNGTITKKDNGYIINPKEKGSAMVTVFAKGNKVSETKFRVKMVPDPVAIIKPNPNSYKYLKGGEITKTELLNADGIKSDIEYFDFDVQFKVVSFVLSTTVPNSMTIREEISKSDQYSEKQIDLIKSLITNQKLTVENIAVVGPDGMQRKLAPMVFTVIDK